VLTTFSSHVARLDQSFSLARRLGRRIGLLGRSVQTVVEIAERLGRLSIPSGLRLASQQLSKEPRNRLFCFASGSQGEPFSALSRLALDEHADLRLEAGDLVVFSARTIPGHERSVNRLTDHLVRRGARVIREADPPVHVSGHAHQGEIVDWISRVRPRVVLPIHGERRMLTSAAEAAAQAGVARERIFILDSGDRLTLSETGAFHEVSAVPSGRVYFDARPELVEPDVVRDRRQLAEEGFVVVFVSEPDADADVAVISRGVAGDGDGVRQEVQRAARSVLARASTEQLADAEWLRAEIAIAAKRACRRAFDIRPVIVPVVG